MECSILLYGKKRNYCKNQQFRFWAHNPKN